VDGRGEDVQGVGQRGPRNRCGTGTALVRQAPMGYAVPPMAKGPKPKPPERVRSVRFYVMLTPPEAEKIERLAAREGVPPSTVAYALLARALARRR
jgi:hypothetical protein